MVEGWWLIFYANTDLQNFQFFSMTLACGPWRDIDWLLRHPYPDHFYYVGEPLGSLALLPFGEAMVVPWHPSGSFPNAGISFVDEAGRQRNFTLTANHGDYGSPIFFSEFTYYDINCIYCANDTP